ncbi:hypothetical protein K1T71_005590 [Dendrolimus kikuchii]|uniref:Uncharacterized protein n=1 Tax=Dendrolimus kikuchii TaxID=765133 RepID=A0ACC1D4M5_9NEOP|nr:hypothetical protein K1T71_005590 [Dendrolimus kikuchii]
MRAYGIASNRVTLRACGIGRVCNCAGRETFERVKKLRKLLEDKCAYVTCAYYVLYFNNLIISNVEKTQFISSIHSIME